MRIQCPKCSQRFDVTEEFLGKTVECGSCDHQFDITDDHLVTDKKKFYPGEKSGSNLDQFSSSPVARGGSGGALAEDISFRTAAYKDDVDAREVGPVGPRRVMATAIGVCVMMIVILLFLFAGGEDGAMRDLNGTKRYILAGFAALLGCSLVLFGLWRSKGKAIIASAVLGGALLVLPTVYPAPEGIDVGTVPDSAPADDVSPNLTTLDENGRTAQEAYRYELGYGPVENKIARQGKDAVVAVFVRNAASPIREKIKAYLHEAIGDKAEVISYERGDNKLNGLILFSKVSPSIQEIAVFCSKFGRVQKIDGELRVVDVLVDHRKLVSFDEGKTLDKNSRDYEYQNFKALSSIDPVAKMNAAKRLADSEPRAMRADVTAKMIQMLPESRPELQLELIRGLSTWSKPGEGAEDASLKAIQKLHAAGEAIDKPAMRFMVNRKVEGGETILYALWTKEPVKWSDVLLMLGGGSEILLAPNLEGMDVVQLKSAADILAKTGSADSIPLMEKARDKQTQQSAKKSLQAAIDEIKKRH
ncbi:MAG: MJ0042-type zinc finger domain-containing protein [Akkermansiaceae bacterium]